jgi:hypothetical protein
MEDTYDYSSMSLNELHELKSITEESLVYYKDLLTKDLKEEIFAVQMCYDLMKADMDDILKEIAARK